MVYKHCYREDDVVVDKEFGIIFSFSDREDGFRAQYNGDKLRMANAQEKRLFLESQKDGFFIKRKSLFSFPVLLGQG